VLDEGLQPDRAALGSVCAPELSVGNHVEDEVACRSQERMWNHGPHEPEIGHERRRRAVASPDVESPRSLGTEIHLVVERNHLEHKRVALPRIEIGNENSPGYSTVCPPQFLTMLGVVA